MCSFIERGYNSFSFLKRPVLGLNIDKGREVHFRKQTVSAEVFIGSVLCGV